MQQRVRDQIASMDFAIWWVWNIVANRARIIPTHYQKTFFLVGFDSLENDMLHKGRGNLAALSIIIKKNRRKVWKSKGEQVLSAL